MTLNRRNLKNSPKGSPKYHNTSIRKKALIRQLTEVQFGGTSKANVKVVVRVRPTNQREEDCNARCIVKVIDDHMLVFDPKEDSDSFFFHGVRQHMRDINKRPRKDQKFMFEKIFGADSTNEEVYKSTTQDLINTLLDGYNCSVFAYGATGAGKTFTMIGSSEIPGITFLTVLELYRRIEELKDKKTCEVAISYLEVYNENVRDLLKPGKALNVQETGQQVLVPGLSLHKPKGADELLQMLARGNLNRSQHPTDSNAESSRSHAVFQVFVRQQDRTANVSSSVSIAKLSMIDLAGSERGSSTGYRGVRFREGANINKSLLALGNCINALADGQRHIPYRDSKLTRLLKDSLGGNCRSVMIAAVSPASTTFEDTFNTLRYANRAKTIKTTLTKTVMKVEEHVSQYVKVIEDLREEMRGLKEKIKMYEEKEVTDSSSRGPSTATLAPDDQNDFERQIEELKNQLKEKECQQKSNEREMEVQQRLMEAMSERKALRWELLQLESSSRQVMLKIQIRNTRLKRLKLMSFASQRLEKSVSKCDRSIRNLSNRMRQTGILKEQVEEKLNKNLEQLKTIQMELNEFGESSHPSEESQRLIDQNDSVLAQRDLFQRAEYLDDVVKELFEDQFSSENFICHLLSVTKEMYLRLRSNNQSSPEIDHLFYSVVDHMDESKIMWADQQPQQQQQQHPGSVVTNPEGTTGAALVASSREMCTSEVPVDVAYLTNLPITSKVYISPTVVQDHSKMFRQSIMKSSNVAVPLHSLNWNVATDTLLTSSDQANGIDPHKVTPPTGTRTVSVSSVDSAVTFTSPQSPVLSSYTASLMGGTPFAVEKNHHNAALQMMYQSPREGSFVSPDVMQPLKSCLSSAKKIPENVGNIHDNIRNNPHNVKNIPDNLGNIPENLGNIPENPRNIPDNLGNIPDNLRNVQNNPRNITLQGNSEVPEDIHTMESSLNSTFSVDAAKALDMTYEKLCDTPKDLNVTVDVPDTCIKEVSVNSYLIDFNRTFDTSTNERNQKACVVGLPTPKGSADDRIPPTPELLSMNTTVDLGKETAVANHRDFRSDPIVDKSNSASRKLFKTNLDSTFSIENEVTLAKQSSADDPSSSPGCEPLAAESPEIVSASIAEAKRSPLSDIENVVKPQCDPSLVLVTAPVAGSVMVAPPQLKGTKTFLKKTPLKCRTPGERIGISPAMKGRPSNRSIRRSVSTPSLATATGSNPSSFSAKKKYSGLGNMLRKSSSFLKPPHRYGMGGPNEENVPPGVRRSGSSQAVSAVGTKYDVSTSARRLTHLPFRP